MYLTGDHSRRNVLNLSSSLRRSSRYRRRPGGVVRGGVVPRRAVPPASGAPASGASGERCPGERFNGLCLKSVSTGSLAPAIKEFEAEKDLYRSLEIYRRRQRQRKLDKEIYRRSDEIEETPKQKKVDFFAISLSSIRLSVCRPYFLDKKLKTNED